MTIPDYIAFGILIVLFVVNVAAALADCKQANQTKHKRIALSAAVEKIPDGASVMVGGFLGVGTPHRIIAELVRQGRKSLTVIANDTARPEVGVGLLIAAKAVRKVVVSVAIIRRARELIVLRVGG
jgi:hypothetical protein